VPHHRIVQIHLAGTPTRQADHRYRRPRDRSGLGFYRETIELTGSVSTLIEWDAIPDFPRLAFEAEKARAVRDSALFRRERALGRP
jgi:uncharacterized protein (UPF0276 family)